MSWNFMWTVCLADDSNEVSRFIIYEKLKKKKKKKKIKSVICVFVSVLKNKIKLESHYSILLGALGVKILNGIF